MDLHGFFFRFTGTGMNDNIIHGLCEWCVDMKH